MHYFFSQIDEKKYSQKYDYTTNIIQNLLQNKNHFVKKFWKSTQV